MNIARGFGPIIGVLFLLQLVTGVVVNFVLLAPVFAAPGFLVNAAGHSLQVSLSVLLDLAAGLLTIGIATTAFQVFRHYSHAMALWFFAVSVVSASLSVGEGISVMSLLSLSEAYTKANLTDPMLFQALRVVVASARNWTHYISMIVAGCSLFVFYSALLRFALVPRALAAFGLGAVLLQITAVAMPLFGKDVLFLLLMPVGLSQLFLSLWLTVKGLPSPNRTVHKPG
jgi:hypothetical protein